MVGQDEGAPYHPNVVILPLFLASVAQEVRSDLPTTRETQLQADFEAAPQMASRNGGLGFRSGREVILENDFDISAALLDHLPTSDVGARRPWRLGPFLGTWPNNRRRRREEEQARLAESELSTAEHRAQEERAIGFEDDNDFVPCLSLPPEPAQETAAPVDMGAQIESSASSMHRSDTSRSSTPRALPVRRSEDGVAASLPWQASSATGRLSSAIPIIRPDDGSVVVPPPLGRSARPVSFTPWASLDQSEREREREADAVAETTPQQSEARVTPSTGAAEAQDGQEVTEQGDSTPRASRASTPVGDRAPVVGVNSTPVRNRLPVIIVCSDPNRAPVMIANEPSPPVRNRPPVVIANGSAVPRDMLYGEFRGSRMIDSYLAWCLARQHGNWRI